MRPDHTEHQRLIWRAYEDLRSAQDWFRGMAWDRLQENVHLALNAGVSRKRIERWLDVETASQLRCAFSEPKHRPAESVHEPLIATSKDPAVQKYDRNSSIDIYSSSISHSIAEPISLESTRSYSGTASSRGDVSNRRLHHPPTRVLIIAGSTATDGLAHRSDGHTPDGASNRLDREIGIIQREMGYADVYPVSDAALNDIPLLIGKFKPEVLHVSAHYSDTGVRLRGDRGHKDVADGDLCEAIADTAHTPTLVVLNFCHSYSAAQDLAGDRLTIGWPGEFNDLTAERWSEVFYRHYIDGRSLKKCLNVANRDIRDIHFGKTAQLGKS